MKRIFFVFISAMLFGSITFAGPPGAPPVGKNPEFDSVSVGPSNSQPVLVLAHSAVPVGVGGTTSAVTLATITIPANTMGANGMIRLLAGLSFTSSANNKNLSVKFGGTGGTQYYGTNFTTTRTTHGLVAIHNRNDTSSQVSSGGNHWSFTNSSSDPIISSYDTTQDQDLVIIGTTSLEAAKTTTGIVGDGATATATFGSAHGYSAGEFTKISGATPAGADGDPVEILTVPTSTTLTYASTLSGSTSVQPDFERYSVIQLDSYSVEVLRVD